MSSFRPSSLTAQRRPSPTTPTVPTPSEPPSAPRDRYPDRGVVQSRFKSVDELQEFVEARLRLGVKSVNVAALFFPQARGYGFQVTRGVGGHGVELPSLGVMETFYYV